MMYHAILAILMLLPVATDEPYPVAAARLQTVAKAVDVESELSKGPMPRKALVATTLSIWWHESRLSPAVHRGERTRWGSDVGKAKCFGQLHASGLVPPAEWETLAGTDLAATRRCAAATMRVIQAFARQCRWKGDDQSYVLLFGAYATGRGCVVTKHGPERLKTVRKVLGWLR